MSFTSSITDALTAGLAAQFSPTAVQDKEVLTTALETMRINANNAKAESEILIADKIVALSEKHADLIASGNTVGAKALEARLQKLMDL